MKKLVYIALLTHAIALKASPVVQIMPAGEFSARDGRPGPGLKWRIDDEDGVKLAAELTSSSSKTAFVFDYEHQTFKSEQNGKPAPAAAWATKFEWRNGEGLFATDVKWTEAARLAVEADEYRYISPVIVYTNDGRVVGVINAAITNTPAVLGMDPVGKGNNTSQQQLTALLSAQFTPPNTSENDEMNLLQLLIAALSLKADASEQEAMLAVSALKAKAEGAPLIPQPLAAALSIKVDGDVQTAVTAIETLKAKAAGSDSSTVQTMLTLQTQVAELTARLQGDEVAQLVAQGLKEGKLMPATEKWATELGKANLAQLKSFLASAPAIGLGTTQTGGRDPGQSPDGLSDEERLVCAQLGLSPADFIKHRTAAA
jgi:phage I-like protein